MPYDDLLLVSVREAARRISMGKSRAYRLIQLGLFPGAIRIGGTWRISVPALEAWVEDNLDAKIRESGESASHGDDSA